MANVQVSRAGDVAELVISAPPLNLFDGQMIADLAVGLTSLLEHGPRQATFEGRYLP